MRTFAIIFVTVVGVGVIIGLYRSYGSQIAVAQAIDPEREKRLEWDKNISVEKLARVDAETKKIQTDIIRFVERSFPHFKLNSEYFVGSGNQGVGRKGQAGLSLGWTSRHGVILLSADLAFSNEDARRLHEIGMDVPMGGIFPAPEVFGQEARIVKNVNYNKTMTNVALHFVKGRIRVSGYFENHRRKNTENEKALIEFMKAIYPLLNAKQTIEEV